MRPNRSYRSNNHNSGSNNRLHRSNYRIIAGVCAGYAEYFRIDPTIVRLLIVFFTLLGGAGVLLYLISWIIMPEY